MAETIEIEKAPTKFPFTTIDDVNTIDTKRRCHILTACPSDGGKPATCCGEAANLSDCYFGCRACSEDNPAEVDTICGRYVCPECRAVIRGGD